MIRMFLKNVLEHSQDAIRRIEAEFGGGYLGDKLNVYNKSDCVCFTMPKRFY